MDGPLQELAQSELNKLVLRGTSDTIWSLSLTPRAIKDNQSTFWKVIIYLDSLSIAKVVIYMTITIKVLDAT